MRVVLIHGSVGNGPMTWPSIEPLRERFDVVLPNRGGYPPGPPLDRIDFETQAEELAPLLEDGAHLVGHSYGGVISLLIAARYPERVRSLAVSEPPAFGVARGRPEVERLLAELAAAPFPKLVLSGAHHPAFDAVCDVLEERLGAERAVLPGAGHSLPRAPGYAERLEGFLSGNT